jgi:hypothetical protein
VDAALRKSMRPAHQTAGRVPMRGVNPEARLP